MDDLTSELKRCQTETGRLKTELNSLDMKKQTAISRLRILKQKVIDSIRQIREAKSRRDLLTSSVKESKTELESAVKRLNELKEKEGLPEKEKISLMNMARSHNTMASIKRDIERLETRIETEAIRFDEEQRLMKLLKSKKKILDEIEKLLPAVEEEKAVGRELSESREKIAGLKEKIRANAAESQRHHEQMMDSIRSLGELKAQEQDAYKAYRETADKFRETNTKLKESLKTLNSLKMRLDTEQETRIKERQEQKEKFFEEKEKELREKMIKGKKLTTRDLLIFQANN